MKNIFVINGSASDNSSNQRLIDLFAALSKDFFQCSFCSDLKTLPHFDPALSIDNTPASILALRQNIEKADGILICTPEYVFSIPSGLKNAIEWCISTTIFEGKPTALITASAQGEKGHASLQLIMQTVMANFTPATTLLVQGIRGKVDTEGNIADKATKEALAAMVYAFKKLVEEATALQP